MAASVPSKALRLAEKTAEDLARFQKQAAESPALENLLRDFSSEWKKAGQALAKVPVASEALQRFRSWNAEAGEAGVKKTSPEKSLGGARRAAAVALAALAAVPLAAAGSVALQDRIHRLRIKAEILSLRARLGRMRVRHEWDSQRDDFSKRIDRIRKRIASTGAGLSADWDRFRREMTAAYRHLGKALTRP